MLWWDVLRMNSSKNNPDPRETMFEVMYNISSTQAGDLIDIERDYGDPSGQWSQICFNDPFGQLWKLAPLDPNDPNYTFEETLINVKHGELSIPIHKGWNLVSTPFIPQYNGVDDVGIVLNSIWGNCDRVRWFNASDASDHWKDYNLSKPDWMRDLRKLNNSMGFWMHAITDCIFYPFGFTPTQTSISLKAGWNLAGYPSINNTTAVSQLFAGAPLGYRVQCFDSTSKYLLRDMTPSETMLPGNGYWVYVPNDWVWVVMWQR